MEKRHKFSIGYFLAAFVLILMLQSLLTPQVRQILRDKRPLLDRVSAALLEKEMLDRTEFERLVEVEETSQVA